MTPSSTVEVRLPAPLPHQVPILASPARFKTVACGRRWGKTALGLMACIDGHGGGPGAVDGATVWWVTSNYKTANTVVWPDLKRALSGAWTDKSELDHRVVLPGGGSVAVRSADNPDSLRGPGLDGLVVDEAAFQDEYLWRDVLRPALADRRGWAIFISTPNGKNWFHDLFKRGGREPGWASWQRPTADNPLVTAEELAAAYLEGPGTFRQEFGAEFLDVRGAEWPAEWFPEGTARDGGHWFDAWPAPEDITLRVMAVDSSMGKQSHTGDPSAIVALCRDRSGLLWVEADIERRPVTRLIADGLAFARRLGRETGGMLDGFGVEADVFQELIADEFWRQSRDMGVALPVYKMFTHGVVKALRIRRLTPYLSNGNFRWRNTPGTQRLVRQAREFPVGREDDGLDAAEQALRLGIQICHQQGG